MKQRRVTQNSAFVLLDVILASGIVLAAGVAIWTVLHTVMVLSAKNEAINLTHQQCREVVNRLGREIRSSVSIPQLVDATFTPVSGTSQAVGVVFQTLFRGPNKVWNNCNASSKNVRITRDPAADGDPLPKMRLIIPVLQVEADILKATGVNGQNGVQDIQLENGFGQYTNPSSQDLLCNAGSPVYLAYVTQLSAFLLVNGDLRYYRHYPNGQYVVVARNIVTTSPFSFKNGDNRSLAVDFLTRDPHTPAGKYRSLDLKVSTVIPYRYRLATYQ
jgi:hypothetical protein